MVFIMTMKILDGSTTGAFASERIPITQDQRSLTSVFLSKTGVGFGSL